MATTIIENIEGNKIPSPSAQWIPDSLDQTFAVIIRSKRRLKNDFLEERNRILYLL